MNMPQVQSLSLGLAEFFRFLRLFDVESELYQC